MKLKCAEFCTGVGGFRLGIEASSLDCDIVYSNELNDACEKTYEQNFGKRFDSKDLMSIDSCLLPDFDMICAGFPCQPFSQAGKELGFMDPRGTIFFKLLEIIKVKGPKIVFLENVVNLIRHDKGRTYKTILSALDEVGYDVSPIVLNSAYFGVPQSRSRIYIVGVKRDSLFTSTRIYFREKLTRKTAFRPYICRGADQHQASAKWQEYIDLYTGRKQLSDMSFEVPKSRKTLERISKGCDLGDCVLQVRSSGVRAWSIDDPMPTFTVLNSGGGAHIPILTKERRTMTIDEMKAVMGFPHWYDFSAVSRTDAAKQLANAVCPPVIASICNDIRQACFPEM